MYYLSLPGAIGDDAHRQLKKEMNETHGGVFNANKVALFQEGLEAKTLGVKPKDSQMIELRIFQEEQIAGRIYAYPAHKLGLMQRATFNNVAALNVKYATDTIRPICARREMRLDTMLLTAEERKQYYFQHDLSNLFKGDPVGQAEYYSLMIQSGILSVNEARRQMDRAPVEGGDKHQTQVNLQDITVTDPEPSSEGVDDE